MGRYLYIICIAASLLALSGGRAHAQRCLPGMRGVELRGGMVGGSEGNYYLGAGMSVYTKRANRWVFGVEYLRKGYEYRDITVPREQFTAEGGYYLKFFADPSKMFFLSLGGSAMAGYETINGGGRLLPDGARLLEKDRFVYGGALTLELEAYLTDRIVLLANLRERALWGSPVGNFSTTFGLGIKVIIN